MYVFIILTHVRLQAVDTIRNEFDFRMFMESWILQVSCKVNMKPDSMNIPKIEFITYIYILL